MASSTTSRTIPQASMLARVDFGLLFTLALCLFALWPLFYRPGLPNGNDVLYHVYRAAEMDRAWSHGLLMPRWAEAFYTGYGAPLFHYYASLSYYATSLLMRLFSLSALDSMRALIVICPMAAGAGMYLFAKPRGGMLGGVIAALCYVYSPYMLFTEPYSRGAYPEFAALALFPLVIWAFDRLLDSRRARGLDIVFAAVGLAALILTHNLMGLVMTGLLVGWLAWRLLTGGRGQLRLSIRALITAGLGIGLAAYFWIPVILESGAVRLGNLTAVAQLDYRNFFVPLHELLAFSPRFDAGAINGLQHQFNLGVPQWVLALTGGVGIGVIRLKRGKFRVPSSEFQVNAGEAVSLGRNGALERSAVYNTIFFALAGAVCVLLMLPAAEVVWGPVAPLAFLQFPWRFLGPAGFCLAMLAGMNGVWIERLAQRVSGVVIVAVSTAIVAFATPLLYITEWHHLTVDTSVAAYHEAEVGGLQRATTFSNEYLPKAVEVEPDATDNLLADYADGYPVDHLNPVTLPAGVRTTLLENSPQHSVWQVTADAAFPMEVLIFDWVGWTAEVDGQVVPITPSNPHGLITFPVPAGEHMVRVYLASTPARDLGVAVTLLSVVGVVAVTWLGRSKSQVLSSEFRVEHSKTSMFALGAAFIVILGWVTVYMREGVAWVNSPPGEALLAEHQTAYHLGESIRLLGYDLNSDRFRPGETVELRIYWYTDAPIPYGYASFVHISMGGPPLAQADKLNPAGRPTKEWTSDGYIRDDYTIHLPDTIPPGEYQLMIGLYTCDTLPPGECGNGERLLVSDAGGNSVGDAVPLQTITVQ